jgi:hypothetical protein
VRGGDSATAASASARAARWPQQAVLRRVSKCRVAPCAQQRTATRMAAAAPEGEAAARLARLGAACAACFGSGREPSAELVAAVATALGAPRDTLTARCI